MNLNKSKKIYFKIGLDLVMLLLLITFFNKRAISMSFHEVGGIVFFILFIVHLVLNGDWIKSVTSRLFKKGTGARLIVSWIINLLLFIVLTGIIFTGISMNKTLPFKLSIISHPQQLHYFFSALSVILMGIHLGLHWPLFKGLASKVSWLSGKAERTVLFVILSLTVILGCYNLATGSFSRWISGPFNTVAEGDFQGHNGFSGDFQGPEKPNAPDDSAPVPSDDITVESNSKGNSVEKGMGNGNMDMTVAKGKNGHGSENFSLFTLLQVMFTYFSEMIVFAFITVLISKIRKAPKSVPND